MEQAGRNKTKYNSPHSSATWSNKPTADARVSPDTCWKYAQRSNQDAADKNTSRVIFRRHQTPVAEAAVNYYPPANSYKNVKHHSHSCSTYPKHSSALHAEAPHRYQPVNAKSSRNNDYVANNAAVMTKDRYKSQPEDESNAGYIDEASGNYTEDNIEDDAEEEAVNDHERIIEPLDKEYDEQVVDDEVDDESDVAAEPQTMQRNAAKKEASLRAQQRLRTINQQQDPHRIHYRQHSPRLHQAHALATRYYNIPPDHDLHEALSEEDLYVAQALKSPPRGSSAGYYPNWIPPRSSADRYDTTTSPTQLSRGARTRPESKSFMEVEFADRRKCSRCGSVSIRKPPCSRRNNYRFQDASAFSTKGRFGDDAEILDQFWCGHCKQPRRYVEESMGPSEIPSPALYSIKSRRSRNSGTPVHETSEGKCATDELSHGYMRIPLRYAKDASSVLRDRIRQQPAQGPTRTSVRYDP
ncbi:uncharacterized protein LOC105192544 isoform X2 [Harpegnathos saltator]|uniref:uncharacterized protein LOC105192544 isoform X2 n=1 Tax=Harpegnathos saltator TaxID=610380 RepID=UPI00058DFE10|nr:uncharacterized protein LOC105192544 isoform X2 [Harpegnathos saltator]